MAKDVKAKRVTKTIEDDYDGFQSSHEETRWVIVDAETGKLLDDARGYGYRTAVSAYKGWSFVKKTRENLKAVQEEEKAIRTWLDKHPVISESLDEMLFHLIMMNAPLSKDTFFEFLKELTADEGLPVPAEAFFRYFRKERYRSAHKKE